MSRRCIGYEGEGRLRRPIWDTSLDPVPLPANPPGPIERRQLSDEELAAVRAAEPVRRQRSPKYVATADDRARAQQSRMNGARRHVEVVTARRPKEEQVMASDPDPVMEPTALERLAEAAQAAHGAHEDKQVADEAWEIAQAALTAAWRELPAEFLIWDQAPPTDAPPPQPRPAAVAATGVAKRQPGHHPSKADEARERDERAARVMAAMARLGGNQQAVAAELGMKSNAVAMVVKHARLRQGPT